VNGPDLSGRSDLTDDDRAAVGAWDWRTIYRLQREARARVAALPRCRVCGRPLTLGQPGVHKVCRDKATAL
jgi:hypothetical protein